MKKISRLLIITMIISMLAAPAAFAAIYEVDEFTGDIISSDDPTVEITRVKLGSGCIYDKNEKMYEFDISDSRYNYVRVSVADGMAVTRPVSIEPGEGTSIILYKDGEEYSPENFDSIKEQGQYVLYATLNEGAVEVMNFTILNECTGIISSYTMPTGFSLVSVTMDDNMLTDSGSTVSLTQEGDYKITYRCQSAGVLEKLNLTIDHTAPTLELAGVVNGIADGPVSLADKEEGAVVSVILDGKEIGYASTLTRVGDYQVVIQDQAGNATNYNFAIKLYFDIKSWVFLAIIFATLVGVAVYILVSRKNLRVR